MFFASCEEKMVVIPEQEIIESGKVILIEELTGVRCPNCPTGTEKLKGIQSVYPDNVVIVGVHGVDLAKPWPDSKYDFRNDDAEDLEIYLKPFLGKPAAYFNRILFEELNGDWGNPFNGQWRSIVDDELLKDQTVELILGKEYDETTRELEINVGVRPLEDVEGTDFKLTIYLTQNEIIDIQEDLTGLDEDYQHDHVLMDAITAFNGDTFGSELKKNNLYPKTYKYTLPEEDNGLWDSDHIEVVVFIANTTGESEEVLQAGQIKLKD